MTTTQPSSSTQLSLYTGDPQQILLEAIAAKAAGHLNDEQFNAVVASTIPVQRVEARPIASSTYVESDAWYRARFLLSWLRRRRVLGTVLIALTLFVFTVIVWAAIAFGQVAWLWLQVNIVKLGVGLFIAALFTVIFKVLSVKDKYATADLVRARQPLVVHGMRGDER